MTQSFEGMTLRLQEAPERLGYSIWGFQERGHGHPRSVAISVTMEQQASDYERMSPFLTIDRAAAQRLMDDLWNAGLRPREERTTGEHLSDLRKIAFGALKKLGVQL